MKELIAPRVLKNAGALVVLQISNYIIPLILLPYLFRTLGAETFGSWMFATSFVIFARIFVSYGFDLTATREVAVAKGDTENLSHLVTNVLACKLVIWVVFLGGLLLSAHIVEKIAEVRLLILLGMGTVLGEALFPAWFFLGMEEMSFITLLRLGARLLNLALVFLFVHAPEDVAWVPVADATTSICAAVMSLAIATRRFGVKRLGISLGGIRAQIRGGAAVFLSTVAVQLYTTAHLMILGFLVGPVAVAAYALADKIYSACRGMLNPLVQAIYPVMARVHETSGKAFGEMYYRSLLVLLPMLALAGFVVFVSAPSLVEAIAGVRDSASISTLRIFAVAFPFAVGGFLSPMLVVRGASRMLMWISIASGVGGLCVAFPLIRMYGAPGAAVAFLGVQVFTAASLLWVNHWLSKRSARRDSIGVDGLVGPLD